MKIGTTLHLEREGSKLRSRLVEKQDGELYIDLPTDVKTDRTIRLSVGTRLKVSFTHDDGGVYTFPSQVVAYRLDPLPTLIVTAPRDGEMTRIQRRAFVRVPVSVDVAVHPKEERFVPFSTTTANISAGGAAIRLPPQHGLKVNMTATCWFVLPMDSGDIHYLRLDCRILDIRKQNKAMHEVISPMKYLSVTEKERQRLIRFCFEQQLLLKRKGLESLNKS